MNASEYPMPEEQTFVYAAEIEQALVSVLWRKVTLMERFMTRCKPETHLTQPRLRIIFRAIELAYGDFGADLNSELNAIEGASDWPIVVSVVRELGLFEECGGLAGLNEVYSTHEPSQFTNDIFHDYVRMLCDYADARRESLPKVCLFTGGRGTIYQNQLKKRFARDDFKGEAIVAGKRYLVRGEVSPDAVQMNLRFEPQ